MPFLKSLVLYVATFGTLLTLKRNWYGVGMRIVAADSEIACATSTPASGADFAPARDWRTELKLAVRDPAQLLAALQLPQELAAAIGRATGSEVELTWMHQGAETRKRIALGTGVQDGRVQVRARPPAVPPPAPSDTAPIATDSGARIESLETRIRALEERIKELESRLTPTPAGDTEKEQ